MLIVDQVVRGRYRVIEEKYQGGHTKLFLAEDIETPEPPLIERLLKVPRPDRRSPKGDARLQREYRIMAHVHHSSPRAVVSVFDWIPEVPCIVMQYCQNATNLWERYLAARVRVPAIHALALLQDIALALEQVHDCDVVHRDLTPGNVLIQNDGTVLLTDFGIALWRGRGAEVLRLTGEDDRLWTKCYSAPEQYRSPDSVGIEADLFPLGVLAFELLEGRRLYRDIEWEELPSSRTTSKLELETAPPKAARDVIFAALSTNPSNRPSAGEFARAMAVSLEYLRNAETEPIEPTLHHGSRSFIDQVSREDDEASRTTRRAVKAAEALGIVDQLLGNKNELQGEIGDGRRMYLARRGRDVIIKESREANAGVILTPDGKLIDFATEPPEIR